MASCVAVPTKKPFDECRNQVPTNWLLFQQDPCAFVCNPYLPAVWPVTRWLFYFLNIWPFWTMKICPKYKILAQLGIQFCQILNSYCRSAGTFFEFYLSSEISTNLVTLRLLACLLERIKKLRIRWSHVLYFFLYKDQGSFQLKMSISKRKDFIGNVEISFENLPF